MRWAALFVFLAFVTVVAYVIRGALNFDGLALLTVAFLVAALLSGLLSMRVDRLEMERKYPR